MVKKKIKKRKKEKVVVVDEAVELDREKRQESFEKERKAYVGSKKVRAILTKKFGETKVGSDSIYRIYVPKQKKNDLGCKVIINYKQFAKACEIGNFFLRKNYSFNGYYEFEKGQFTIFIKKYSVKDTYHLKKVKKKKLYKNMFTNKYYNEEGKRFETDKDLKLEESKWSPTKEVVEKKKKKRKK